jgi:hypothetical protein
VTAAHVSRGHLGGLCNAFCNLQGAVVSAALHKHARGSIAALARITVMSTEMSQVWGLVREFVGGPEAIFDAASDGAFIGIGEDEISSFPAQFQRDALQSFCSGSGYCFACTRGASEGDHIDVGMCGPAAALF